tara:strand:- start:529 stop:2049 length:1521 start_codon:yes stop_codon:yes gene_type:complete
MILQNINQQKKIINFIPIIGILFVGLLIRIYYLPYELPLLVDSLSYFTYATEIVFLGDLPTVGVPANNGWPMFLSFWFSIINLDNTIQYMQLQKIISLSLSSLTVIPIFFLCKKFFNDKLALVGAALFIFDPRIILNSLLGITEPIFIFLTTISLVLFLTYKREGIVLSFILVSFSTIIRSEGIFLFFIFIILFFIRYKISNKIFKILLPSIVIFILILIPVMDYRIDTTGTDSIFLRVVQGTSQTASIVSEDGITKAFEGLKLFTSYLGWIMIPSFIIFLPFGVIQFLRKRNKEGNFIIIFLVVSSIPILYAYFVQAQDTRYLYVLYPIFCLLSLFAVESYISKIKRKNIIIIFIILGVLSSSIIFYEFKNSDYEKEKELYEIGKIASKIVSGVNTHPTESRYISAAQIPNEWPFAFHDDMYQIKRVSTINAESLQNYILNSKNELSHILIDNDPNLPEFLKDINKNEEDYPYLKKVFDSKDEGFNHQVKIFEIDYNKFDSLNLK